MNESKKKDRYEDAKKFVRYSDGAKMYSMGMTKFQEVAKDAKACYKIGQLVLVNTEILDKYLESFKYENEPYYIEIDDVAVFPQCYAAVVDKIPTMAKKTLIVDIGSWTIDIMPVINKSPDESKCVTIPKGLITCMRSINEQCVRQLNGEVDESEIQNIMRYGRSDIDDEYFAIIKAEIEDFVDKVYNSIREFGYNLKTTVKAVAIALGIYAMAIVMYYTSQRNYMPGKEFGTARFENPKQVNKILADKDENFNRILSQNVKMSLDFRRLKLNGNILICGGSGAGKTFYEVKPNLMQMPHNCSFICTDPKGEILRSCGQMLKNNGYNLKVINLLKGRAALYRVSEFLGIKKRLLDIRENVRGTIKTTDKDIAKTALLAKGFREAGQTAANAFRTFADKPEVGVV